MYKKRFKLIKSYFLLDLDISIGRFSSGCWPVDVTQLPAEICHEMKLLRKKKRNFN